MKDRTFVVTGANAGLGKAVCTKLAARGATVIGIDLAPKSAELDLYYQCDLAESDQVLATFEAIAAKHGPVYGLVNNAAHYHRKMFFDIGPEDFERTFAVNVRANFVASQILGAQMVKAGRGVIINVGSLAGRTGSLVSDYGASKAAVFALTQGLAKTLSPKGVRVNAIAPGAMKTAMFNADNPMVIRMMASNPIARAADPEEMASVVVFLASDEASYVTGAIVDVNGGAY